MVTVIELTPHVGIGPVQLGQTRAAVHQVMGPPDRTFKKVPTSKHVTDAWGAIRVFYTAQGVVEFIEASKGSVDVAALGMKVFSTPVTELVEAISQVAPYDDHDPELGYSYVFPTLELAFWRPVMGEPEGRYFSTVGLGARGYFGGAQIAECARARSMVHFLAASRMVAAGA